MASAVKSTCTWSGEPSGRFWWVTTLIALSSLVSASAQPPALVGLEEGEDALWEARTALEQFRTSVGALQRAQVEGDEEALARAAQQAEERLSRARELFERGNAAKSDDVEVLGNYAEALRLSQDYDLAAEVTRRITQIDPEDARAWLALGRDLPKAGRGHTREALEALRTAVGLEPEPSIVTEALTAQGVLLFEEGLYELSAAAFDEAVESAGDYPPAAIGRAALWIRDGKLKEAADLFDRPGLLPPQLGGQLRGMIDRALDDFVRRRIWFVDTAENHVAYAKLLIRFERVEESVLPLERALALDGSSYVNWNLLASVCRSPDVQNSQRAREAYTKSLELNPDQPRVREGLEELAKEEATGGADATGGAPVGPPAAEPSMPETTVPEPAAPSAPSSAPPSGPGTAPGLPAPGSAGEQPAAQPPVAPDSAG